MFEEREGGPAQTCSMVYVIAIHSNVKLPNDVMSRQGLNDWWGEGVHDRTCLKRGTSPLFIVTVHSLKLHPA